MGFYWGYTRLLNDSSYEHESIKNLISLENKLGINKKQTLLNYASKINDLKLNLNNILRFKISREKNWCIWCSS